GVLLHRSSSMTGVGVTDTSGRPRSLTLRSRPWSADWSATGPSRTVVPSACRVRVMPSNHAAQRSGRCPFTRISYRSDSSARLMLVASFAVPDPAEPPEAGAVVGGTTAKVALDVVSGHHHT